MAPLAVNDVVLRVEVADPPNSPSIMTPIFTLCDSPTFSRVVAVGGTMVVNPSSPTGTIVGIFEDSTATETVLSAPVGEATNLKVLGVGSVMNSAEFRIEISNPSGYFFNYIAPANATVTGSIFDLDANDPANSAGATVVFNSCTPDSVSTITDLGTISVINVSGSATLLTVRPKIPPDDPGMPCARYGECQPPLFPQTCLLTEVGDIVFQTSLTVALPAPTNLTAETQGKPVQSVLLAWNTVAAPSVAGYKVYRNHDGGLFQLLASTSAAETAFVDSSVIDGALCYQVTAFDSSTVEGAVSDSACVIIWLPEQVQLDAFDVVDDGDAGPVSIGKALRSGETYRVDVAGSFSLWPPSDWTFPGAVVCGLPELTPLFPSPATANGWVGVDAERVYAAPLPSGSDCSALPAIGLGPDSNRFQIDLGSGFVDVEPRGGDPTNTAPGHSYSYEVIGQGSVARFRIVDNSTTDNYGVLSITVEEITAFATDVKDRSPKSPGERLVVTAIPNPFNPSTRIRFEQERAGFVKIRIYDVRGRMVRSLYGMRPVGTAQFLWDGRDREGDAMRSGIYYAKVDSPEGEGMTKLVLLK